MKLFVILAGPNGSGKSTIASEARKTPCFPHRFINPDEITRLPDFACIPDENKRNRLALKYASEFLPIT